MPNLGRQAFMQSTEEYFWAMNGLKSRHMVGAAVLGVLSFAGMAAAAVYATGIERQSEVPAQPVASATPMDTISLPYQYGRLRILPPGSIPKISDAPMKIGRIEQKTAIHISELALGESSEPILTVPTTPPDFRPVNAGSYVNHDDSGGSVTYYMAALFADSTGRQITIERKLISDEESLEIVAASSDPHLIDQSLIDVSGIPAFAISSPPGTSVGYTEVEFLAAGIVTSVRSNGGAPLDVLMEIARGLTS